MCASLLLHPSRVNLMQSAPMPAVWSKRRASATMFAKMEVLALLRLFVTSVPTARTVARVSRPRLRLLLQPSAWTPAFATMRHSREPLATVFVRMVALGLSPEFVTTALTAPIAGHALLSSARTPAHAQIMPTRSTRAATASAKTEVLGLREIIAHLATTARIAVPASWSDERPRRVRPYLLAWRLAVSLIHYRVGQIDHLSAIPTTVPKHHTFHAPARVDHLHSTSPLRQSGP